MQAASDQYTASAHEYQLRGLIQRRAQMRNVIGQGFRDPLDEARRLGGDSGSGADGGGGADGDGAARPIPAPGGAYTPLVGACHEATLCAGEACDDGNADERYVWTLCPFQYASQAPAPADGDDEPTPTLLGHFLGWNVTNSPSFVTPTADLRTPRATWRFAGGERCWQGPARSVLVELRCAASAQIVRVAEDGKCRYEMLFVTPAACALDASEVRELETSAQANVTAEAAEAAAARAARREKAAHEAEAEAKREAEERQGAGGPSSRGSKPKRKKGKAGKKAAS